MSQLHPTTHIRNNETQHHDGIKRRFTEWLKTMPITQQRALRAELRQRLSEKVTLLELTNIPRDDNWRQTNKAVTKQEAQRRADASGKIFVVFAVQGGVYGIVPRDSFHTKWGTVVATVRPRGSK